MMLESLDDEKTVGMVSSPVVADGIVCFGGLDVKLSAVRGAARPMEVFRL
jgi:hypothetical protein